jgi:hypothetical protein
MVTMFTTIVVTAAVIVIMVLLRIIRIREREIEGWKRNLRDAYNDMARHQKGQP